MSNQLLPPDRAPVITQLPIRYQPQRATPKYAWIPWLAFVLSMIGLYLFATYYFITTKL